MKMKRKKGDPGLSADALSLSIPCKHSGFPVQRPEPVLRYKAASCNTTQSVHITRVARAEEGRPPEFHTNGTGASLRGSFSNIIHTMTFHGNAPNTVKYRSCSNSGSGFL